MILNGLTMFQRRLVALCISVLSLSLGWLGFSGFSLLFALVPLLWISSTVEDSRAGWLQMLRWSLCAFVLWNFVTIWWIGFATVVGPFAATFFSAGYSLIAFMAFHTASKRVGNSLAYVLLVSLWIALEYHYMTSDFSWPWLLLGNGFSNDIWAVQWYEYTGMYGGSLWILLSNIAIFRALFCNFKGKNPTFKCCFFNFKSSFAVFISLFPVVVSLLIYCNYDSDSAREMRVAVIQPNVDCYDKFNGSTRLQEQNLIELIGDIDDPSVELIVLPETAVPGYYNEKLLSGVSIVERLRSALERSGHGDLGGATLITGANTLLVYGTDKESVTARRDDFSGNYFDIFNSAIAVDSSSSVALRHKSRLVIGVENTPSWIFDLFNLFVIDLGGVVGQIGKGETADVFDVKGAKIGAAICYEALYGDFYGEFIRNGAQLISIISNDGWWGDTLGHRHLYSFSSLRAVEHRRAIARSANTGVSGFIDERGVSLESMGWDERGVMICDLPLNDRVTFYTRYGDYVARIAVLLALLSLLYLVVFIVKRRQYLV